jgi:hypothetical protein
MLFLEREGKGSIGLINEIFLVLLFVSLPIHPSIIKK